MLTVNKKQLANTSIMNISIKYSAIMFFFLAKYPTCTTSIFL